MIEDLLVGGLEALPIAQDVLLRLKNRPFFHLKRNGTSLLLQLHMLHQGHPRPQGQQFQISEGLPPFLLRLRHFCSFAVEQAVAFNFQMESGSLGEVFPQRPFLLEGDDEVVVELLEEILSLELVVRVGR